jgi:hypothetical protein
VRVAPQPPAQLQVVVVAPSSPAAIPIAQPKLPQTAVATPALRVAPQPVEIAQPQPAVLTKAVIQPLVLKPVAVAPAPPAPPAAVAAATSAPSQAAPVAPAAEAAPPSEIPAASAVAAPSSGTQPTSPAPGRGPDSATKPGAWPTPHLGDDWGASTRNRPGGNPGAKPGLFNADGTPRLPAGSSAAAGGGFPPGGDHWTRDQIDRAGTWLKRPPNDYTPTRFDQNWLPSSTLLEEWVRRGVRQVAIPIPGTSKKISCVISLLQLGGGCAVTDPNLNDQEATARPPPDIPFKPELQEDQGALRKPGESP